MRQLIRPTPGNALAYIDYSQQEFGIGAVLSGDANMLRAYISTDPYLEFAKLAGAVPPNATKRTHSDERANFKACVLAVQYGMGAQSLSYRIRQPIAYAQRLLDLHRGTFSAFWEWSDALLDHAMTVGQIETPLGWRLDTLATEPNPRSIRNFPMQAGGAECLRLACCLLTEAGISVCGPVHDAVLIEAPLEDIDRVVIEARELMAEASRQALDGLTIRTDVDIIRYPDRFGDATEMWDRVLGLAQKADAA